MHCSERYFPRKFNEKKPHQNQMKNKLSVYKYQKHPFLYLRAFCFETGTEYNTQNKYQPLYSAKDRCVQNSEWTVNYNLSYHTETILSTNEWRQQHNILFSRKKCRTGVDVLNATWKRWDAGKLCLQHANNKHVIQTIAHKKLLQRVTTKTVVMDQKEPTYFKTVYFIFIEL